MQNKIVCDCCGDDDEISFYEDGICICRDCEDLKKAFDIVRNVILKIKKKATANHASVADNLPNGALNKDI